MSERGFIAITRGALDHPLVGAKKPYSEYEAWHWMLFEAAYRSRRIRIGSNILELQRGQLAHSERFLASKWGWSKSKVHRFFSRLETEAMVSRNSDHETNLITICNYEEHQNMRTTYEPQSEPQTGPAADQQRTKERNQLTKEQINISPRAPRLVKADDWFEKFWAVYPKRASASPKKPSRLKFETIVKRGTLPEAIIAGARQYAAEQDSLGKTGTQYVKTPEVWLNQEGWTAYEQARAGPPPDLDPIARMRWVREQMDAENGTPNKSSDQGSREILDRGESVCPQGERGPEEPQLVLSDTRDDQTTGGMGKLLLIPPRLSASGN